MLEAAFAFYISLSPLKNSFKDLAKQILERSNKVCQDMPLASLHLLRNFWAIGSEDVFFSYSHVAAVCLHYALRVQTGIALVHRDVLLSLGLFKKNHLKYYLSRKGDWGSWFNLKFLRFLHFTRFFSFFFLFFRLTFSSQPQVANKIY